MARPAVLAGRTLADVVTNALSVTVLQRLGRVRLVARDPGDLRAAGRRALPQHRGGLTVRDRARASLEA
jgi:hypothetical protein